MGRVERDHSPPEPKLSIVGDGETLYGKTSACQPEHTTFNAKVGREAFLLIDPQVLGRQ
jgi:hypothetical protein